jgi:hypothetical protein
MLTNLARILLLVVLVATASIGGKFAFAGGQSLIASNSDHVAILGYDSVAYFTDKQAVVGSAKYSYKFDDVTWLFSSDAHRILFIANPEHYMPQYGGFCAGSMSSSGGLVVANPKAWVIVGDKLYMFAGAKFYGPWTAQEIAAADQNWRSRTGQ